VAFWFWLEFELTEQDLSFIDQRGKRIVEAGDFEITIGGQ